MKFEVEGILRVTSKDGKQYGRIDYMGGSVSVMLGREFNLAGIDDDVRKFIGQVRFGKTGAYFLLESAL